MYKIRFCFHLSLSHFSLEPGRPGLEINTLAMLFIKELRYFGFLKIADCSLNKPNLQNRNWEYLYPYSHTTPIYG